MEVRMQATYYDARRVNFSVEDITGIEREYQMRVSLSVESGVQSSGRGGGC